MPRTPEHDGRRGEAYVRRTSQQFAERFPWSDLAALEICNAINACYNSQRAALRRVFEELGVGKTLGRSTLLRALLFAGRPLTHNEIGNELEVTPGSVTYLVDGLEKEGLAQRTVDPNDRRTVYVRLTAKGEELAQKTTPAIAEMTALLCRGFTKEEKQVFLGLLLRFLDGERNSFMGDEPAEVSSDTD